MHWSVCLEVVCKMCNLLSTSDQQSHLSWHVRQTTTCVHHLREHHSNNSRCLTVCYTLQPTWFLKSQNKLVIRESTHSDTSIHSSCMTLPKLSWFPTSHQLKPQKQNKTTSLHDFLTKLIQIGVHGLTSGRIGVMSRCAFCLFLKLHTYKCIERLASIIFRKNCLVWCNAN